MVATAWRSDLCQSEQLASYAKFSVCQTTRHGRCSEIMRALCKGRIDSRASGALGSVLPDGEPQSLGVSGRLSSAVFRDRGEVPSRS